MNLLHQKTSLSFVLHHSSSTSEPSWHARGVTSLYVLVDSSSPAPTSDNNNIPVSLGFCLRGTCQVVSVQVEAADKDLSSLVKLSCDHQHFDPLERVLLKPPISFTMDDVVSKTKRHEADSHWTRGATGMTNAVRAASIASNMGELRISTVYQQVPVKEPQMKALQQCWKRDISLPLSEGEAQAEVKEKLEKRADQRKASRIDLVAKSMAAPNEKQRALKVTVRYNILLGVDSHFGGIHAITGYQTPHIYTTSGVYGDHEGPRSWIPTLDSASTKHRASHDMTIQVTALMSEGLSVVGFGEDYGATETYLHDLHATYTDGTLSKVVGKDLVEILDRIAKAQASGLMESPHIIPPEPNQPTSMDNILATSIWSSCSWLPISSRSLGFAIGPFRVLEDPEYFSVPEDDGSEEADEAKAALESTRANGEGIRQAYFAPIFSRKFIHAQGNTTLIPNTQFLIAPLTQRQLELSEGIDQSLLTGTTGVPHRALSLMRDILALPSFRTVSYTQIWIPGAVHGGATSGSLHNCPEAMVNPFLGGSIMDSRLLPPVGHRLPHHLGGRVLQFLQARCAVRGWITSAVPLGGRDDVGQGYIHTLIESLLMSLYERGHGAHGEGML